MRVIADEKQVAELVARLARELEAAMKQSDRPWAIVGIRSRGDVLAERLAKRVKVDYLGSVDIALYRDDLSEVGPQPVVRTTEIDFPVDGTNILLVDDVLMSGRSVRAAIQSLLDFGRPRCIKLMVLVDRGGRELPIAPDFVGQRVAMDSDELVEVRLAPTDPDDEIVMFPRPTRKAAEGRP
ncbi:MAG: bifunctional pyr operon transcriptional regulator/uracil phosphoribosyltransferase PyrR [Planctomycetes bacterium]|nr:bifunctional pyr operon transcriptional regulator/uracil phosphoribosyltransferase PyrR [Planctomycetota bacterium]